MKKLASELVARMPELTALKSTGAALANTRLNVPYVEHTIADLAGPAGGPLGGTALIIGAGPSLHRKNPVEQLLRHGYDGDVVCADGALPFDTARFDTVVTTWTLCSIPDSKRALGEMRRVLKPGGRYLFIEHGRAPTEDTARWQDRVNPLWRRFTGGCNMNRPIHRIVQAGGFELAGLERFRHAGPSLLAHMYRGVAIRGA